MNPPSSLEELPDLSLRSPSGGSGGAVVFVSKYMVGDVLGDVVDEPSLDCCSSATGAVVVALVLVLVGTSVECVPPPRSEGAVVGEFSEGVESPLDRVGLVVVVVASPEGAPVVGEVFSPEALVGAAESTAPDEPRPAVGAPVVGEVFSPEALVGAAEGTAPDEPRPAVGAPVVGEAFSPEALVGAAEGTAPDEPGPAVGEAFSPEALVGAAEGPAPDEPGPAVGAPGALPSPPLVAGATEGEPSKPPVLEIGDIVGEPSTDGIALVGASDPFPLPTSVPGLVTGAKEDKLPTAGLAVASASSTEGVRVGAEDGTGVADDGGSTEVGVDPSLLPREGEDVATGATVGVSETSSLAGTLVGSVVDKTGASVGDDTTGLDVPLPPSTTGVAVSRGLTVGSEVLGLCDAVPVPVVDGDFVGTGDRVGVLSTGFTVPPGAPSSRWAVGAGETDITGSEEGIVVPLSSTAVVGSGETESNGTEEGLPAPVSSPALVGAIVTESNGTDEGLFAPLSVPTEVGAVVASSNGADEGLPPAF
jgi:hypothetical protein